MVTQTRLLIELKRTDEIRCPSCRKFLAERVAGELDITCTRCKTRLRFEAVLT
jgi:phage FluMu protein Com